MRGLPKEEIERIMNDPTWTKAIMFRDPAMRLLSAYFYTIKKKSQINAYRDALRRATKNSSTSWDHFLMAVTKMNHQNLHWRPQVDFCRFEKFYPLFNFVGNLERSALHGPMLLKQAGVWDQYGTREWALTKVLETARGANPSASRYKFKLPEGYNQSDCMFCDIFSAHKNDYNAQNHGRVRHSFNNTGKGHHNSTSARAQYMTSEAWQRIRNSDFYKKDYATLNRITASPFDKDLYFSYPPPMRRK
eukprot:CAMPEP_0185028996 /NCGR_PEP_ID=MMETSP1103-20130426/15090_1 /TAXON_ID=36769 /ORGANISM="Paraphysomonas bandaiensis, Strain Caron Lab Isolate" /LENGTH=246 /DNA_ID=CAMNT_0027563595 /DNA_START=237 /DNA_END=977 /DNA_ORIENTATION=+